jgi:flagellar motor component MotA
MFRWRSIAATAAAIGVVLASKNAQDTPNLGNLLANHSELSTFYGYIQVRFWVPCPVEC